MMKRFKYAFTIALLLTFKSALAHMDFWVIKDYGNVKVRILTGFNYEEISKVLIFGQLAQKYSSQINYSEPIFLDFNHHYTGDCDPDYFISYDKGKIQDSWQSERESKDFLKSKSIVVRQVARQFNAETTLKLLEYAILNLVQIKLTQAEIEYNENYCNWKINSIDTTVIKKQVLLPASDQINNALKLRVDKCEEDYLYGLSYFLQDNKYTFFSRDREKGDNAILTLNTLYDLKRIDHSSMVIFDTDSSFYRIDDRNKVSKRHIIQDRFGNYDPFEVVDIGGNKLSIYFLSYPEEGVKPKHRNLIYLIREDKLIQDLDKLISEY